MGFNLGGAIKGAVGGLLTGGGPTGAILGAVSGGLGGGGSSGGGGGGGVPGAGGTAGAQGGSVAMYGSGFDPNIGKANLYLAEAATALSPLNAQWTQTAIDYNRAQAPIYAALGTELGLRGQDVLGRWEVARDQQLGESALMGSIAANYAGAVKDIQESRAQAMNTLALAGPGVQADLARTYGQAAANLEGRILEGSQNLEGKVLEGERALFDRTATGLAQSGLGALTAKNQAALNTLATNLDIRKAEADTFNELAKIRGAQEADLARRRFTAGLANNAMARIA